MTTIVMVRSPKPNHMDIWVEMVNPITGEGVNGPGGRIVEGEERQYYVHNGQDLRISEIAKETDEG